MRTIIYRKKDIQLSGDWPNKSPINIHLFIPKAFIQKQTKEGVL